MAVRDKRDVCALGRNNLFVYRYGARYVCLLRNRQWVRYDDWRAVVERQSCLYDAHGKSHRSLVANLDSRGEHRVLVACKRKT